MLLGSLVLKQNLQQECPLQLREVENEPLAGSLELQGLWAAFTRPERGGGGGLSAHPHSPGFVSMAFSTFPGQPEQHE